MKRLHELVILKKKSAEPARQSTMGETYKKHQGLIDLPLQTKFPIPVTETHPTEMENSNHNEIAVKQFKSIEGVLSMKDLEIDLPASETKKSNKSENEMHIRQMNEEVLAKITSAQRSICAVIDLIL